jgi:hypothetical protein
VKARGFAGPNEAKADAFAYNIAHTDASIDSCGMVFS